MAHNSAHYSLVTVAGELRNVLIHNGGNRSTHVLIIDQKEEEDDESRETVFMGCFGRSTCAVQAAHGS